MCILPDCNDVNRRLRGSLLPDHARTSLHRAIHSRRSGKSTAEGRA